MRQKNTSKPVPLSAWVVTQLGIPRFLHVYTKKRNHSLYNRQFYILGPERQWLTFRWNICNLWDISSLISIMLPNRKIWQITGETFSCKIWLHKLVDCVISRNLITQVLCQTVDGIQFASGCSRYILPQCFVFQTSILKSLKQKKTGHNNINWTQKSLL
jgi:hypothetical protein